MKSKVIFCFIGVVLGAALTANGASIANGNFDTGVAAGFDFTSSAPASWTHSLDHSWAGSGVGLLDVQGFANRINTGQSNPAVAWLTAGRTLRQGIGETVTANLQLQLTFDVGVRADGNQATDFSAGLFTADGDALATADVNNVAGGLALGEMKTVTLNYDAGANPGAGILNEAIEVRLSSLQQWGLQIIFDDVSVSVVPEPTTYALISGLGLVGMAAYRRRHKLKNA